MNRLQDQVIIVTGAGSGMGRETAHLVADEGARVVLIGRQAEPLEEVAAAIAEAGGEAHPYPCDITSASETEAMVAWVRTHVGPIDALVNSAGASCPVMNPLYLPEEQLMSVLDVNLVAVFRLVRLVLPEMLERRGGTIITVSSLAALTPNLLGGAAYGAAKAGVRNFMTFLHTTFRGDGLRAITVLPGETNTPILDNRPLPPAADVRQAMLQSEDVAETILMALCLPARACAQEIVIAPTRQRDPSADIAFARHVGAPFNERI